MEDKRMMFALLRQRGDNQLDDLTTGLVNAMRYSDHEVVYPGHPGPQKGDGVHPAWFYEAYKGSNGFSELDAINQYITQEAMFEDIGEMMLGIALVEMKHLDKLGDLIMDLGGQVTQRNTTENIAYGSSAEEAVRISINGERKAIADYKRLMDKVAALPQNRTTEFVLQLLAKLIADERVHVRIFEQWLRDNGKEEEKGQEAQ